MPRLSKKWRGGVLVLLLVLTALVTAAVYYLESGHARKTLQRWIDRAIPGTVSWEDTRLSIADAALELSAVRLEDAAGTEIAFIEGLFVELAWRPLLRRQVVIERLRINRPRVNLVVDPDGSLNLLRAVAQEDAAPEKQDKAPAPPTAVMLRSLLLTQGSLRLAMPADDIEVRLGRLDLTASADVPARSGRISLQSAQFEFRSPGIHTGLEHLDLEVGLKDGRLDPLVLTTGNDAADLEVKGVVSQLWDAPVADVTARVQATLSRVRDLLALEPDLTGELTGDLRLHGTMEAPRIEGRFDYGGGILFGQAVEGMRLSLALKERFLRLAPSEVRLAGGRVGIEGELDLGRRLADLFDGAGIDPQAVAYRAELTGEALLVERLTTAYGNWRGPLSGTVTLEGKGLGPLSSAARLSAEISGSGISGDWLSPPADLHVAASGNLDAGVVTLQSLAASAGPVTLSAEGQMDFSTRAIEARLTLDAHELEGVPVPVGLDGVSGRLHVDAAAAGTLSAPAAHVDVSAENFHYQEFRLGDVTAAADLNQTGILRVSAFQVDNGESSVSGRGSLRLFGEAPAASGREGLDLAFDLKNVRVTDFISPSPVGGRFDGRLRLSGSLTAPEAELTVKARQVSIMDNQVGDVDARAHFFEGTLAIGALTVTNGKSGLTLSGSADLLDPQGMAPREDPRFDIAFDSKGIHLEDIAPRFKGVVTASGDLRGSLKKPQGSASLTGRGIDLGYQKLEAVTLSAVMDGSRFRIDDLILRPGKGESIQGGGWFRTDGSFGLDLSSDGVSLDNVANAGLADTVSAKLVFDLTAGGTLERPTLEGKLSSRGLRLNGRPVEDADLSVSLADDLLEVKGRLNFGVEGTLDLRRKELTADLRFDRTELAPYFRAAGQADLSGEITGTVRARGNLAALERLDAAAEIVRLRVDFQEKPLVEALDWRLSLENGVLTLPKASLRLPGDSSLDVGGSARLDGPVDVGLKGKLPVSALGLVTDAVSDLTGHITIDGRLTGPAESPRVDVELAVVDGGLTITELGQRIEAIRGRMTVTNTEARLSELKGRVGGGTVDLNGRVALKDYRPAAVTLNLDAAAVPIEIPGTLDMLLSSRLALSGTLEKAAVSGEIVLLEGSYHKDVNLSLLAGIQSLATKRREVAPAPAAGQAPWLDRISLDVGITARHPFSVQNNLADLEIRPDLRLKGAVQDPVLTGRSQIEAGTVTYGKTVFDIQKGVIDFNNPYRIEPTFDILSQAKVRDWLITLTITGTPEALDFNLSSDPPLESADIGSLLLFGKTSRELAGGSGPGSGQSAANMLAELLASTYAGDIKEKTGLDVFEFSADTDSQTREEHISVTVGKEISERMTLKYQAVRKSGDFIQRAIAEYKLLENLLVSGFQDTSGSFGGSVKYRLEFR